jgi:hypothetical protein
MLTVHPGGHRVPEKGRLKGNGATHEVVIIPQCIRAKGGTHVERVSVPPTGLQTFLHDAGTLRLDSFVPLMEYG